VVDGAALGSGLRELDYEMKLRNLQDYQRQRSGREDQLKTSGQHISREALQVRTTIPLILMVGPFGSVGAKFPWAKPMAVKLVPTRPMASTKLGLKMDMFAIASVVVCACWDMRVLYLRGLNVVSRGMLASRNSILYVSMAVLSRRARSHNSNRHSICVLLCMAFD
jgi:hypothetical protein